jgi:Rieske Fe-S protein
MTDVQSNPVAGSQEHAPTCSGSGPTRRNVLVGAGAVGATCLLAACGTQPAEQATPAPAGGGSAPAGGGSAPAAGGATLAAVADVPSGGGIIKGDYVITQPSEGTFKAFSKVCTHQGCDVSEISGGVITCKCHNSVFSIEDGSVKSGPAKAPLAAKPVKVDGGNVVTA